MFFQFSSPSGLLLLGLVSLGSTVGTSPRCCTPILISFDCCSDGNRYSNSSSRHRYSHSRTTHHHSHSRYCTHEKPHGLKETPPFGIQRYYFSCGNTVDIIFSTGLRPFFVHFESHKRKRFTLCRFAPVFDHAFSTIALYASTLSALTIRPRKARREPIYEYEYEASLSAYAYDTPPLALAKLYPRKTTRLTAVET